MQEMNFTARQVTRELRRTIYYWWRQQNMFTPEGYRRVRQAAINNNITSDLFNPSSITRTFTE